MQVATKTMVVTGAGSGIGRELTLQLLRKGASVAGVDINQSALLETQQLADVGEERFKGYVLDITDQKRVENFSTEVITQFGAVDGLINNAGIIQPFKPVNELPFEQINRVMQVNFYGTVYLTKAFLPHLLSRPEAHIVNVSSMGGFIPFPGQTLYGAAKAAVKLFTEGLHAELAGTNGTNVRVTVVHPGAIATNITANSGLPGPTMDSSTAQTTMALSASKAAGLIIRGMEQNSYRVLVGRDATLLDILYRISPKQASRFIGKLMKKTLAQRGKTDVQQTADRQ